MPVQMVTSVQEWDKHIKSGGGVFVDFFAEWCGPCKQVAPKLEAYAEQYPDVTFLKVDVDNDATQELSSKNGISAMPTFIAFLGGEEVGKVVGANLAKMEDLIKKVNQPKEKFVGEGKALGGAAAGGDDPAAAREARAKAAEARMAGAGAT